MCRDEEPHPRPLALRGVQREIRYASLPNRSLLLSEEKGDNGRAYDFDNAGMRFWRDHG